ncbi:cache domain-containing protein [Denitrovibrio acetiphilus]|uniref:cache domain-containing protein n=1 Tax=Denitrovibrio acetiphilus TaxID=118000 RepID=UPI00019B4B5F|nr:cache domain-containing protein [Denitrovibrio acetiphilus]
MRSLSLKFKISFIAALVFAFTLIVVISSSYFGSKKIVQRGVQNQFTAYADETRNFIDSWLESKIHEMNVSANTILDNISDEDKLIKQMKLISDVGNYDLIYLGIEADGKFLASTPTSLPDNFDPRTRPWYQSAVASEDVIITKPYINASDGAMVISFAKAVKQDGNVLGVVACDLNIENLRKNILNKIYGETGYTFITNKSGLIIIHPDEQFILKKNKRI